MAEQLPQGHANNSTTIMSPRAETKEERGCFDFILRKSEERTDDQQDDDLVMTDHDTNDTGKESKECNKHTVMDELRRAHSHSISSSDEEVEERGERKKKKKKGLKQAFKEKLSGDHKEDKDTTPKDDYAPTEKCCTEEENANTAEKKGFLEKMKEKTPGPHKKAEQENQTPHASEHAHDEAKEKKGIVDMIKDKLPGQRNSNESDVKKTN